MLLKRIEKGSSNKQISNDVNTYSFFLANNMGERELYVGKMTNVYDRGEIPAGSPLTYFIPSYYASDVGSTSDIKNLFLDVTPFLKVDKKYLDNITLESTGDKILSVSNSSSVFLTNIDDELERLLIEMLNNLEANIQYQVEQEDVGDDVIIDDQPKDKPSKTSSSGSSSYKRDSKTSKKAIVLAKYLCEIDPSHQDFISRVTGKNYIEANLVSLCVSCHKTLHHATYAVIKPLIEKLCNEGRSRLKNSGISISKQELLKYYK